MSGILLTFYATNRKLVRYVKWKPWFYFFAIGLICLALIVATIASLFIEPPGNTGYKTSFGFIAFFVAFFDLVAIILRIQSRSFIEPHHLALFPISKWRKLLFQISLLLIDYKTFIYISVMVCFVLFFVSNSLYIAALVSIPVWVLLLIAISSWIMVIYAFAGKYLDKIGDKIQFLGLFFIAALMCIQLFGDTALTKIPVINYTGNMLYGLWIGNLHLIWLNLLLLLGSIFLPLVVFGIFKYNR